MFVGGEFYEDTTWMSKNPSPLVENALFLNGGRACLSVISDNLCANKINQVLLPGYLCPSILDVLNQYGINYGFYRINEDFSIDLDDLCSKVTNHQAVYFINYFGFQHSNETISELRHLQTMGTVVIEDNAQAGFLSNSVGDFVFNSMRKICAFDGGYLATRNNPLPQHEFQTCNSNDRLPLIRQYRRLLRSYLFEGRGTRDDLERLFYQAEDYYERDGVIAGDPEEQANIEQLNWESIKAVRRNNYTYLLDQIIDLPCIQPIYPALQPDIMPLGLPVYVSGFSRDYLIDQLAEESISLTVHWDALLTDPRTHANPEILKIANRILTLPVDQYTSISQLDYLVENLHHIFGKINA